MLTLSELSQHAHYRTYIGSHTSRYIYVCMHNTPPHHVNMLYTRALAREGTNRPLENVRVGGEFHPLVYPEGEKVTMPKRVQEGCWEVRWEGKVKKKQSIIVISKFLERYLNAECLMTPLLVNERCVKSEVERGGEDNTKYIRKITGFNLDHQKRLSRSLHPRTVQLPPSSAKYCWRLSLYKHVSLQSAGHESTLT